MKQKELDFIKGVYETTLKGVYSPKDIHEAFVILKGEPINPVHVNVKKRAIHTFYHYQMNKTIVDEDELEFVDVKDLTLTENDPKMSPEKNGAETHRETIDLIKKENTTKKVVAKKKTRPAKRSKPKTDGKDS